MQGVRAMQGEELHGGGRHEALPRGVGVLLVGHGTVADERDMPDFLLRIRRGRPPTPELVEDMVRRYRAIGGSPLLKTAEALAERLGARLGAPVQVGMRFAPPELEDALQALAQRGVWRAVVLPLAPYSVALYCRAARDAAARVTASGGRAPDLVDTLPWGRSPQFVEAWARAIRAELDRRPARVIYTAHSLPVRVIQAGDPYAAEVAATAAEISAATGRPGALAWQSAGEGGGEWLRPSLDEVIDEAVDPLLVAPIGFVQEHVETLYDLDHEAIARAAARGVDLVRVRTPETSGLLLDALEGEIRSALRVHSTVA